MKTLTLLRNNSDDTTTHADGDSACPFTRKINFGAWSCQSYDLECSACNLIGPLGDSISLRSRPLAHRKHLPLDIIWDVLESRALGNSKLLGYILNKLDSETNGIYRF